MKKYQIIYADPPWKYKQGSSLGTAFQGAADRHYSCMDYREICNLPVRDMSAIPSCLFIWVTMPMLKEGLAVIDAWDFEYKTCGFVWVKVNKRNRQPCFGVGYYAKSNVEFCLLATKGNAHVLVKDNSISQVVIASPSKHSRKPSEVRSRIVKLLGDLPRIELFARKSYELFEDVSFEGWDVWGNEVESDIELGEGDG